MNDPTNQQKPDWQQKTIEKLLFENLKEQKRKRRWGIFFKLIVVAYFATFLILLIPDKKITTADSSKPHTALINIRGAIFDGSNADAKNIIKSLDNAFASKQTKAVILKINSPGGSPVQADYIYNEIMRLRNKHKKVKVYAVCSDICTSAAYYIASASNDIYADPSSIVGSIGVLLNGFGFVDTMKKLGVERRLLTAGSEKGFLDPFSPLKSTDIKYAKNMLDAIHTQFINKVKQGRGQRLKNSPQTFSGLAWTGEQAKQLGLIDGFGSPRDVARNVIKITNIVNYTHKPSYFERLSERLGTSFSQALLARFGFELR